VNDREPDPNHLIGFIQQPILGGMLSPTLNVMEREGGDPFATITAEATCCIGGMCCDHTFKVEDSNGNYMGKIVKERPEGMAQIAKELGTDADNFTLYLNKDLDVQKKANLLAALHLIDYWLFESEGDFKCDLVNGQCSFKLCDMYCCGAICPYSCVCGGGEGGGDRD
jgi:Scramblase